MVVVISFNASSKINSSEEEVHGEEATLQEIIDYVRDLLPKVVDAQNEDVARYDLVDPFLYKNPGLRQKSPFAYNFLIYYRDKRLPYRRVLEGELKVWRKYLSDQEFKKILEELRLEAA